MVDHNKLLLQAEELADMIMQAPEVAEFKDTERILKDCSQAQVMMNRLKEMQEKISDFQSRNVPEKYFESLSAESESLMSQLENIPEVQAFRKAQEQLNMLLKDISDRLALSVAQRIAPQRARVGGTNAN